MSMCECGMETKGHCAFACFVGYGGGWLMEFNEEVFRAVKEFNDVGGTMLYRSTRG